MMPRDPAAKHARGTGTDEPVMQTVNILDNFEYLTRYGFPQHIWTHTCFFCGRFEPASSVSECTSSNLSHR